VTDQQRPRPRLRGALVAALSIVSTTVGMVVIPFAVNELNDNPPAWLRPLTENPVLWLGGALVVALIIGLTLQQIVNHSQPPSDTGRKPPQEDIVVRVSNSIPVYDLPDGSRDLGDHFVSVEAYNAGDRLVTVTGWGIELPGDRSLAVFPYVNWATRLPHELRPGAEATRHLVAAEELRRVAAEEQIDFKDMRPYVCLADGRKVYADKHVLLA